jgi:hypothetical protein
MPQHNKLHINIAIFILYSRIEVKPVLYHTAGAVLKEIKILGFGGPGLKNKNHVLKEHSSPAPVLEGEGRIYKILWRMDILRPSVRI